MKSISQEFLSFPKETKTSQTREMSAHEYVKKQLLYQSLFSYLTRSYI